MNAIGRGVRRWWDRPRRWRRVGRLGLSALGTAYLLLFLFPAPLFAYRVDHGTFRLYSDEPIDPRAAARVLDEAAARLAHSPLNDPAMEHRLYLCNGPVRWHLLAPRSLGAFGATYGVLGHTILHRADMAADRIERDAAEHRARPLSSVIAHERMHALLTRRYGTIGAFLLPQWKAEGYCDYVGGHPSFPEAEGRRLVRAGRPDDSPSFRYYRYGLMVRYLLDVERIGVDALMAGDFDEAELLAKVRANIDRL